MYKQVFKHRLPGQDWFHLVILVKEGNVVRGSFDRLLTWLVQLLEQLYELTAPHVIVRFEFSHATEPCDKCLDGLEEFLRIYIHEGTVLRVTIQPGSQGRRIELKLPNPGRDRFPELEVNGVEQLVVDMLRNCHAGRHYIPLPRTG